MRKITKEQKGITLVALVVTIIILLILAGVAIATVTGDNGLFRKAREAVNTYKDAEANESQSLDYIASQLGDLAKYDVGGYAKETTEMTVSDGTYYLPEGFKLASDSGKTINEGIVVEDKNGNQWVWIPCYVDGGKGADVANAIKYDRYDFAEYGNDGIDEETGSVKIWNESKNQYFTEMLQESEKNSIEKYGGFFIGRYESGDGVATTAKKLRESNDPQTNTVTIKKGQAPYNYVTQDQSVILSNGIMAANNYNTSKMYTKLCSSYAWDTMIKFIEQKYPEYPMRSKKGDKIIGNFWDITGFKYIDITGKEQTKTTGVLIPTGGTEGICNLYDVEANLYEFTSEKYSVTSWEDSVRGGVLGNRSDGDYPALRGTSQGVARIDIGFRATLYLK